MGLAIAIYSDVCCPWCWIGRRRLGLALADAGPLQATISWHPFRLNPDMPLEGMPRELYRRRKFGSDAVAQARDAQVTAVAGELGLAFALNDQPRTPSTLLAHRLIWLAGREGVQEALVESLFQSYFCAGQDVGDPAILVEVASRHRLERERVATFLAGHEGRDEVIAEEAKIRRGGLDGVPLFLFNRQVRVSGAQQPAVFARAISDALAGAGA